MATLHDLKIDDLRDLNATLGIPNRKSRADNINQITYHLKKTYNYTGPYTVDAVNYIISKGPPISVVTPASQASDINVSVDTNKLVSDLINKGIVKPSQIGDPNHNIGKTVDNLYVTGLVNVMNYQHTDDSDEEEEDPDPATRYAGTEEEDIIYDSESSDDSSNIDSDDDCCGETPFDSDSYDDGEYGYRM